MIYKLTKDMTDDFVYKMDMLCFQYTMDICRYRDDDGNQEWDIPERTWNNTEFQHMLLKTILKYN